MRTFFLLFILLPFLSQAGSPSLPDSVITLPSAEIRSSRLALFAAGHRNEDTEIKGSLQHASLSGLLSSSGSVYQKMYAAGMLSTTSIRGGSAQHTSVLWNGIRLDSPMNGQNDLSLLPVFMFDNIRIQYGGGTAIWGSGAMGGSIHLNNQDPEPGQGVSGSFMAGTLGELGSLIRVSHASNRVSASFRYFSLNSRNQYRFMVPGSESGLMKIQEHASYVQQGILAESQISMGTHGKLDLKWWYQESDRNIPPAVFQSHMASHQKDNHHRFMLNYQTIRGKNLWMIRSAWFNETLEYTDSVSVSSLSQWTTQTLEAEWRSMPGRQVYVSSGISAANTGATATNYQNGHHRFLLALFASLRWDILPERWQLLANLRQEALPDKLLPLTFSGALSWKAHQNLTLKANSGMNYRLPTFNDLYWQPGGNPDLLPESGWSHDLGAIYHAGNIKAGLTLFYRSTRNWIVWLPHQGGSLWTPANLLHANAFGTEARIAWSATTSLGRIHIDAYHDFVSAKNRATQGPNDNSYNKQLIYVPGNKSGVSIEFSRGPFLVLYSHQYTAKVFTSSDNSEHLPAYHHADMNVSYRLHSGKYQGEWFVRAINLFNHNYQLMAGRPMPLRHFQTGLKIQLASQKKEF